LYDAIFTTPYEELSEEHSEEDVVLASVAGVDFMFNEFYGVLPMFLRMEPEAAEDRRLDQTPDFKLEYYRKKGDLLVSDLFEGVFVPTVCDPTEEEIKAYYEGHKGDFGRPEKMKVAYVAAYDEEKVRNWRELVAAGEDFAIVGGEYDDYIAGLTDEEKTARDPMDSINPGMYIYRDPDRKTPFPSVGSAISGLLEKEVYNYGVGDTSPVVPLEDGRYLFFHNVEHIPYSDKPYKEVTEEVCTAYQNEVMGSPGTDEKLQDWFAGLRAKHEIDVDEAAFKKLYKQLSAEEWEDE
jgi:hypothetical protein